MNDAGVDSLFRRSWLPLATRSFRSSKSKSGLPPPVYLGRFHLVQVSFSE